MFGATRWIRSLIRRSFVGGTFLIADLFLDADRLGDERVALPVRRVAEEPRLHIVLLHRTVDQDAPHLGERLFSTTVTWFFVTRNSIGNMAFIIDGMPSPRQLT